MKVLRIDYSVYIEVEDDQTLEDVAHEFHAGFEDQIAPNFNAHFDKHTIIHAGVEGIQEDILLVGHSRGVGARGVDGGMKLAKSNQEDNSK